jgi:hypothetical protein
LILSTQYAFGSGHFALLKTDDPVDD